MHGSTILFHVLLFILIEHLVCTHGFNSTYYKISSNTDNQVCPAHVRTEHTHIQSWVECAAKCTEKVECKSWAHIDSSHVCYMCKESAFDEPQTETLPDGKFGEKTDCDPPIYHVSGSYGVPNSALTATSFWTGSEPSKAKLTDIGWSSSIDKTIGTYVQVAFETQKLVTGFCLAGKTDITQYVTRYNVTYSHDCNNFDYIMTGNGEIQEFTGNQDTTTLVCSSLESPLKGTCVRIIPTHWVGHMSMRFEVIGC